MPKKKVMKEIGFAVAMRDFFGLQVAHGGIKQTPGEFLQEL